MFRPKYTDSGEAPELEADFENSFLTFDFGKGRLPVRQPYLSPALSSYYSEPSSAGLNPVSSKVEQLISAPPGIGERGAGRDKSLKRSECVSDVCDTGQLRLTFEKGIQNLEPAVNKHKASAGLPPLDERAEAQGLLEKIRARMVELEANKATSDQRIRHLEALLREVQAKPIRTGSQHEPQEKILEDILTALKSLHTENLGIRKEIRTLTQQIVELIRVLSVSTESCATRRLNDGQPELSIKLLSYKDKVIWAMPQGSIMDSSLREDIKRTANSNQPPAENAIKLIDSLLLTLRQEFRAYHQAHHLLSDKFALSQAPSQSRLITKIRTASKEMERK
ncbi:hypothetical protein L0F63_005872, partial [Massospora cicadina]